MPPSELATQAESDAARYIKHVLPRPPGASPDSPGGTTGKPVAHLPDKINATYAEIQRLGEEKLILATKLIELMTKTRNRLDMSISEVRKLQGDIPDVGIGLGYSGSFSHGGFISGGGGASYATRASAAPATPMPTPRTGSDGGLGSGRDPAGQISESLRNALMSAQATPSPAAASADSQPPNKSTFLIALQVMTHFFLLRASLGWNTIYQASRTKLYTVCISSLCDSFPFRGCVAAFTSISPSASYSQSCRSIASERRPGR
jgi:hypothetical protein